MAPSRTRNGVQMAGADNASDHGFSVDDEAHTKAENEQDCDSDLGASDLWEEHNASGYGSDIDDNMAISLVSRASPQQCSISKDFLSGLPAELRTWIWDYVIEVGQENPGLHPVEPPITFVSRFIRTETIPIFWSRFPLMVRADITYHINAQKICVRRTHEHSTIRPEKLKHVTLVRARFDVEYVVFGRTETSGLNSKVFFDKLAKSARIIDESQDCQDPSEHRPAHQLVRDLNTPVLKHLQKVLANWTKHLHPKEITAADLELLVKLPRQRLSPIQPLYAEAFFGIPRAPLA